MSATIIPFPNVYRSPPERTNAEVREIQEGLLADWATRGAHYGCSADQYRTAEWQSLAQTIAEAVERAPRKGSNLNAHVVPMDRSRSLAWNELPSYWGFSEKYYYTEAIQRGERHYKAFREHDLVARAPNPVASLRRRHESYDAYIARLESIACSCREAIARAQMDSA